jgi:outer membrane protein OmpA-like peptidoglycan-associated protein
VRKIIHRGARIGGALGLALILAACGLANVDGPAGAPSTGAAVTITQDVAPSALLAVMNGPASGPALSGLVAATARPNEEVTILQADAPPKTVIASGSPAPPKVVIPGEPVAPGGGETSYQWAQYAKRLKHWRGEVAAGKQADARLTRDAVSAWLRGLGIPAKASKLADAPGGAGSLAAESAAAASALAGLEQENGNIFGSRRVIVLYCDDLSGTLPAGEFAGDKVIVITRFLPTAAAASAAQAELLGAGAAQAAVLGPEVTAAQIAALVSADLSQDVMPESVSSPVLFANDSAALLPKAVRQLTNLLPELRGAGVTVVINGYASAPGTAGTNYTLSYERAAAVAAFFEAHGVPESSLIIVGHGASDLIAPGSSGLNRRVTVVIEKSSGGSLSRGSLAEDLGQVGRPRKRCPAGEPGRRG